VTNAETHAEMCRSQNPHVVSLHRELCVVKFDAAWASTDGGRQVELLKLQHQAVEATLDVQIRELEVSPEHLLDLGPGLLARDHVGDLGAQRHRAVAELTHLLLGRDQAMSWHDLIEFKLQRAVERAGPV